MGQQSEQVDVVQDHEISCTGFHELLDWQVVKYRKAVMEHRETLSAAMGRCVSWQEAEQDFVLIDCFSLSDQWRVECCGMICPSRKLCFLALQFLHKKSMEDLMHKVV